MPTRSRALHVMTTRGCTNYSLMDSVVCSFETDYCTLSRNMSREADGCFACIAARDSEKHSCVTVKSWREDRMYLLKKIHSRGCRNLKGMPYLTHLRCGRVC